jgi:hypothetical protein
MHLGAAKQFQPGWPWCLRTLTGWCNRCGLAAGLAAESLLRRPDANVSIDAAPMWQIRQHSDLSTVQSKKVGAQCFVPFPLQLYCLCNDAILLLVLSTALSCTIWSWQVHFLFCTILPSLSALAEVLLKSFEAKEVSWSFKWSNESNVCHMRLADSQVGPEDTQASYVRWPSWQSLCRVAKWPRCAAYLLILFASCWNKSPQIWVWNIMKHYEILWNINQINHHSGEQCSQLKAVQLSSWWSL